MPEFVKQIGETVSVGAGIKRVFGEKVTVDGFEAIPVAIAAFAYGGGGDKHDNGGGGGQSIAIPVGMMVKTEDGLDFEPEPVAVLAALTPLVLALGFAVPRIIRAVRS